MTEDRIIFRIDLAAELNRLPRHSLVLLVLRNVEELPWNKISNLLNRSILTCKKDFARVLSTLGFWLMAYYSPAGRWSYRRSQFRRRPSARKKSV